MSIMAFVSFIFSSSNCDDGRDDTTNTSADSFGVVADTMLTRSSMGGWAILTFSQSRLLSSFCPSLKIGFSFGFGVFFLGCNAIMDEVVAIELIVVVVLVEGEGLMIGFGSTPKIFARRGSKVD